MVICVPSDQEMAFFWIYIIIYNNIHFRVDSLVLQMVICWSGQVLSYFGMISTKQIRNSSTTHFKHVHQWIFCLFRNERTCDEQTENHHGMCVVCVVPFRSTLVWLKFICSPSLQGLNIPRCKVSTPSSQEWTVQGDAATAALNEVLWPGAPTVTGC